MASSGLVCTRLLVEAFTDQLVAVSGLDVHEAVLGVHLVTVAVEVLLGAFDHVVERASSRAGWENVVCV